MKNEHFWVLVTVILFVRLVTLSLHDSIFIEQYNIQRAQNLSGILPTWEGIVEGNTPPLHAWILAIVGLLDWGTWFMRLPSFTAYALTGIAVWKMSNNKKISLLLWYCMPMPFLLAGFAAPDMLLTMFVAFMAKTKFPYFLFPFAVLAKQNAFLSLLTWRSIKAILFFAIGGFALIGFVNPATITHLGTHFSSRHYGYWDIENFIIAVIGGTGFLVLSIKKVSLRDTRVKLILLYGIFAMYAAPMLHSYYYLPIFPFLASIIADKTKVTNGA